MYAALAFLCQDRIRSQTTALAQQYADRWRASISLCRVPFVDQGQLSGWFADEVQIVAQVVPNIEGDA
jgi:hypothetical protein